MSDMKSILHDLAWSAIPEKVIVRRTASKIADRGWSWERGRKGDIKEMVAETRPPRGLGVKRLKAVLPELERQKSIRSKRARNQPIEWSKWRPRPKATRWCVIAGKLIGRIGDGYYGTVFDFRHAGENVVIYHRDTYAHSILSILRPKPHIGPRQRISIRIEGTYSLTVPGALFRAFGRGHVTQAQADGRQVILDFEKLETRVEKRGGGFLTFPWSRV